MNNWKKLEIKRNSDARSNLNKCTRIRELKKNYDLGFNCCKDNTLNFMEGKNENT